MVANVISLLSLYEMKNKKNVWEQLSCTKYVPECCKSVPQVCYLIDEYLVDSIHPQILRDACENGASSDNLEFILKRTAPNWTQVVYSAARGGYIHVFEWMLARQDGRCPWESDFENVLRVAAAYGHLEAIKWLHFDRGIGEIDNGVLNRAASNGHLSVAQWVYKYMPHKVSNYTFSCAAGNGDMEVVQWIFEHCCGSRFGRVLSEKAAEAMISAAEGGHLGLLQWLHHQVDCDDVCSTSIMDVAAKWSHFDIVKWLCVNCTAGCSKHVARSAAFRGDLTMLQWIYQHFGEIGHLDVMDYAAMGGRLDVLKWLHTHRSEGFSSKAMDWSAAHGYLEVLQWLHENQHEGCTTYAMKSAVDEGHLHVVKWLHENRSEGYGDLDMNGPVYNGHFEMVKWLVEHKPEMCCSSLLKVAAREGHLDVVWYLDKYTRQELSGLGLGAAARKGLTQFIPRLMRCHKNIYIMSYCKTTMDKLAKMLFSELSNQGATTTSPLWYETLEMLEFLHIDTFWEEVCILLDRALYRGYLVMVRQFFEYKSSYEKCCYINSAAI